MLAWSRRIVGRRRKQKKALPLEAEPLFVNEKIVYALFAAVMTSSMSVTTFFDRFFNIVYAQPQDLDGLPAFAFFANERKSKRIHHPVDFRVLFLV